MFMYMYMYMYTHATCYCFMLFNSNLAYFVFRFFLRQSNCNLVYVNDKIK